MFEIDPLHFTTFSNFIGQIVFMFGGYMDYWLILWKMSKFTLWFLAQKWNFSSSIGENTYVSKLKIQSMIEYKIYRHLLTVENF